MGVTEAPTEKPRTLWHPFHTNLSATLISVEAVIAPWGELPCGFCLLCETDHQKFQSSDDKTCRKVYFKLVDYLLVFTFAYIFSSSEVSKSYKKNAIFPLKTSICMLRPVERSESTESSSGPLNSVNNFRIPQVVGN